MDELEKVLKQMLNEHLTQIILSNTRDSAQASKVKIRPVSIKGELLFQRTLYRGTQVFHENLNAKEAAKQIGEDMEQLFKQCELKSADKEAVVLVSKKGKMTIKTKILKSAENTCCDDMKKQTRVSGGKADLSRLEHNRTKQYILQDGAPVDFLIGLGVQSPDGKINKNRYDKFRQINRYLEFIEDVLDELPKDRCIRIIDFGCGKSYLTFAMYYYLHVLQGRDIKVTGLDLKTDVINHCNELAKQLHYDGLQFEQGDIQTYEGENKVDMVVSLHACDTATDYALEKAVKWDAEVIMAVPCCQHELNKQMKNDTLQPILRYGILKERIAALLTDGLRANLLEQQGYDTQILEFIDMEHTPKNLLIRGVKRRGMRPGKKTDLGEVEAFFEITPTLERLLKKDCRE